jgi:hypothetical protein
MEESKCKNEKLKFLQFNRYKFISLQKWQFFSNMLSILSKWMKVDCKKMMTWGSIET